MAGAIAGESIPLHVKPFPAGTPGADTFRTRSLLFCGPVTDRFTSAGIGPKLIALTWQSAASFRSSSTGSQLWVSSTAFCFLLSATGRTASLPASRKSTVIWPK